MQTQSHHSWSVRSVLPAVILMATSAMADEPVPEVEITLKSLGRGTLVNTKTDDSGWYTFYQVKPGDYVLYLGRKPDSGRPVNAGSALENDNNDIHVDLLIKSGNPPYSSAPLLIHVNGESDGVISGQVLLKTDEDTQHEREIRPTDTP